MRKTKGRYQCVVFDLDGTLLDTRNAMLAVINDALESLSRPRVAGDDLAAAMHHGLEAMLQRALKLSGAVITEDQLRSLSQQLSRRFFATAHQQVTPFADLIALLEALRAKDIALAVCTNQSELHARTLLEIFHIDRYFEAIAGRDTFAVHKPDPTPLIWLMGRCRVLPDRTVMVGDSEVDARCAQLGGVPVVLMEHGYGVAGLGATHTTASGFTTLRELLLRPVDSPHHAPGHHTPGLHGAAT